MRYANYRRKVWLVKRDQAQRTAKERYHKWHAIKVAVALCARDVDEGRQREVEGTNGRLEQHCTLLRVVSLDERCRRKRVAGCRVLDLFFGILVDNGALCVLLCLKMHHNP